MCLFIFIYLAKRLRSIQITEPWERLLRNHGSALETDTKLTVKWKRNYDNKDEQNIEDDYWKWER